MGQLGLVIADENNEINLSDFGANLAGIAEDRDGWSVEGWGGRIKNLDDSLNPTGSSDSRINNSLDQDLGGIDAVYRKPGRRALGVTALYDAQQTAATGGNAAKLSGPNFSVFWNEIHGPISAAVRLGTWSDNQNLVTTDVFGISNSSSGSVTTLASAWTWRGWRIGGQLELDRSIIRGVSADPGGFHDDEFNWNRPVTRLRLNLIRPEGKRLAFGVNLTSLSINGSEEGTFRWSDRFASNPSRLNYLVRVPTFQEKERDWGVEGRSLYRLTSALNLGGYASYQGFKTNVDDDPSGNLPGSLSFQDSDNKVWKLGAGLGGTWVQDRLRAGVEGYAQGQSVSSVLQRVTVDTKSRNYALHAGLEWLLPSRIALRAGYLQGTLDENVDQPYNFYRNNGFTVGMGYLPMGGIVSLDAALRILQQRPGYSGGGSDTKTRVQDLEFGARFLF